MTRTRTHTHTHTHTHTRTQTKWNKRRRYKPRTITWNTKYEDLNKPWSNLDHVLLWTRQWSLVWTLWRHTMSQKVARPCYQIGFQRISVSEHLPTHEMSQDIAKFGCFSKGNNRVSPWDNQMSTCMWPKMTSTVYLTTCIGIKFIDNYRERGNMKLQLLHLTQLREKRTWAIAI